MSLEEEEERGTRVGWLEAENHVACWFKLRGSGTLSDQLNHWRTSLYTLSVYP